MSDEKDEFDTGSSGDPTGPPADQTVEVDTGSSIDPVDPSMDPNSYSEPPPPPETATIGGIMFTLVADESGAKSGSGVDDSSAAFTVKIVDGVATVTDSAGVAKTYKLNDKDAWVVQDTGATTAGGRRSRRRSRRHGGSRKKRRGGSRKKRKGSKRK